MQDFSCQGRWDRGEHDVPLLSGPDTRMTPASFFVDSQVVKESHSQVKVRHGPIGSSRILDLDLLDPFQRSS